MRWFWGVLAVSFWLAISAVPVWASEYPPQTEEILDQAPMGTDEFLSMDPGEWLGYLWKKVQEPLLAPARALGQAALYLTAVCLAQVLVAAGPLRDVVRLVGTLGFAQLCCEELTGLLAGMEETALAWHSYLGGFIPIFSGVMVMGGQTAGAGVYSGMFLGLSSLLAQGIAGILIPGVKIYIALAVGAQLWGNQGILEGVRVLYKGVSWLLKGICILSAGVLGLQGMLSQNMDQAVNKGGQALIKLFLPVVGDVATQAFASVAAGLRMLKGTLAFAAVGTVFLQFLPVLAGCVSGILLFWILAAGAKSCGLGSCGGLAECFAQGIQLCLSGMVLYFLLVMTATLMMAMMGGGIAG